MWEGRGGRTRSGSGEGGKGGERRRAGIGREKEGVWCEWRSVCVCVWVHVVRVHHEVG